MNDLIPVLENMVIEHQKLYDIAKEKTEIIKNGDIKGLDRVLVQEEALASRIGQLENRRLQLVTTFLTVPQEEATFTTLIEQAPVEYKETLEQIQLELVNLVFELKFQNDLNQSLLKQSLDWVHLNMSLLQPQTKSVSYTKRQKTDSVHTVPSTPSRFDSRA